MGSTADFRTGMALDMEGQLFYLVEFQHVKPGKGGAFVRTKLKNVRSGAVLERTFRSGESISEVRLERRKMQYLYNNGGFYYLMDTENYDQVPIAEEQVSGIKGYLKENMEVQVLSRGDEVLGVEVPLSVVLAVTETEPGFKGDTASSVTKPARLETGLVVQVPLFINQGDVLKVDTRTGKYLERA
ncbi:MAG TPA: elongation factor P [candidate division Zixibacteria bacterium]|nr:elongation factor P [candidate division Zixibacteria bacterium]